MPAVRTVQPVELVMKHSHYRKPAILPGAALLACWTFAMTVFAATTNTLPDPLIHWSRVLQTYVNERGQVDFQGLGKEPKELQAFVDYIATTSPASRPAAFPDQASRIAYYINSYNALAMYNILDSGIPDSLGGWRKFPFFLLKRFTIGGKKLSLYTYENDIIRKQGEARIHFALNCMVAGCPRLPGTPFTAEDLDTQLDEQARLFFSEPRNLRIDHQRKVVYMSWIMKHYKEDFLATSHSLISYVNNYIKDRIPASYAIKFMPYDWSVNAQGRND